MVREPRRSILVVLLVVVLGACAVVGSAFFGRVGPQPDGTGVTPNQRRRRKMNVGTRAAWMNGQGSQNRCWRWPLGARCYAGPRA